MMYKYHALFVFWGNFIFWVQKKSVFGGFDHQISDFILFP
jgi:hypothetical protein